MTAVSTSLDDSGNSPPETVQRMADQARGHADADKRRSVPSFTIFILQCAAKYIAIAVDLVLQCISRQSPKKQAQLYRIFTGRFTAHTWQPVRSMEFGPSRHGSQTQRLQFVNCGAKPSEIIRKGNDFIFVNSSIRPFNFSCARCPPLREI